MKPWIDIAEKKPPACAKVWGWSRKLNRASVYYVSTHPAEAADDISHWLPLTSKAPKHSPFAAHAPTKGTT